jgi:hypothetical protein
LKKLVYIFALLSFISCKKEVNSNGFNIIGSELPLVGSIDTFKIEASTISFDTASTNNPPYLLLGCNNDPIFGKSTSSFCSQLRLVNTSPNFGDIEKLKVDSVVLSISYSDLYGVNKPLKFNVLRLKEGLTDKVYYANSVIPDDGISLMLNEDELVLPRETGKYFVNGTNDTVYDQITLKLKNELGEELIKKSKESPSTFSTIENFNSWFKGLKVTAKNLSSVDNEGAIYYISSAPKLTIYYTQDGISKKYYYELNQNGIRVNLINHNDIGSEVSHSILYKKGNYYSQSNKLRSYINIPNLNNISRNSVLHSGILVLPYDSKSSMIYNPGYQVSVGIPNSPSDNRLRIIGYGNIDTVKHEFVIDVSDYIQNIISGKRLNLGLYVSPREFSTTATRIKFLNEGASLPKLYLKVSSFKQ